MAEKERERLVNQLSFYKFIEIPGISGFEISNICCEDWKSVKQKKGDEEKIFKTEHSSKYFMYYKWYIWYMYVYVFFVSICIFYSYAKDFWIKYIYTMDQKSNNSWIYKFFIDIFLDAQVWQKNGKS